MIKYMMILVVGLIFVVGLSLSLPVAAQAGTVPPDVAILKCFINGGTIQVDKLNSTEGSFVECAFQDGCAGCIQTLLDLRLDLRQINVEESCTWYHFFEDKDRR